MCWSPLLLRMTLDSYAFFVSIYPYKKRKPNTHLAHGIGVLDINILKDPVDLAFELELPSIGKLETWSVDNGKQDSVEPRLANLDTRSLYGLCALGRTVQEAVQRSLLVNGRGRRDIRGLEQQPQQRGLARA